MMKRYIGPLACMTLMVSVSPVSAAETQFQVPSIHVDSSQLVHVASSQYRYSYRYVYYNGQRYKQRYRYWVYSTKKAKKRSYASRRSLSHPGTYNTNGRKTVVVSPAKLSWAAYDASGQLVRTGAASAGSGYCRDIGRSCRTPRGVFTVQSIGGPGCRSSRYPRPHGGAKMPYCMFFSKYYALHGSYDVPGYNASHGCVRMTPSDARWMAGSFVNIGTRVVITSY